MNNRAMRFYALLWLPLMLVAWSGRSPGQECGTCDPCNSCDARNPCAPPCPPATCTVVVPKMVTEYQARYVTRYRPETRERMVTVYRDVPSTENVPEYYTVLVPQKRTRTVVDTINHPVYGDIELRTTSMTSAVDVRQAVQTVTRLVPVQEQRVAPCGCSPTPTPSVAPVAPSPVPPPPPTAAQVPPAGDPPAVAAPCNTCGNPCATCSTCVTCWKPVSEQVKVQYPVTQFKPESRVDTVSFYEFQPEKKFRQESYVVEVPEERTRTRQITVMRPVTEQQPERYTVMVPYQERILVPVTTCRCVEQPVIGP